MRRTEVASIVAAAVLLLVLFVGIEEGAWAFLSLVQTAPFFIMGGIVSALVWGFRKRMDRLASPPQRFPVERIPY